MGASLNQVAMIHESASMPEATAVARVNRRPVEDISDEDRAIHTEALQNFQRCVESEQEWRGGAMRQLDFLAGDHWTSDMTSQRVGLPCLTFDRIGPSIDQVVNDSRQSPLEPKVSPVGRGADKETATLIEGLIRNIQNDSDAITSYLIAYEHACQIGRGWVGILKDWETNDDTDSEEAFYQKLVVRPFPNPFTVYPDPAADRIDLSDMRFAFVTEDLTKEAYEELYGDTPVPVSIDLQSAGDKPKNEAWYPGGNIRVAEYWRVTLDEKRIALLEGGRVVPEDDKSITSGEAKVIATRSVVKRIVKCYKINGRQIIDRWDWEGSTIPLIPVFGKLFFAQQKRQWRGMIKMAMDGNLEFDYIASKIAEAAALAPKSQWIAAEGQIEGYENFYAEANRKPIAVLPYKTVDVNGHPVPPPQRVSPNIDIGGLASALAIFDNGVKAVLATYDASLGAPGPESSGRAIIARQREGDNAHFGYRDSYARAMRCVVRVFLEMFPHIYDDKRLVMINDPDGKIRSQQINQQIINNGIARIYRLGKSHNVGRYDVVLEAGSNYGTRQEKAWDGFVQLSQAMPMVMSTCADIGIRNSGLPGADEMADRIQAKIGVPPSQEGVPPLVQQTIIQLQQQVQMLQAALKQAMDKAEMERRSDATKERIAAMQEETKRMIALLKVDTEAAVDQLKMEFGSIKDRLMLLATNQETANPPIPQQPQPGQPQGQPQPGPAGGVPGPITAPSAPMPPPQQQQQPQDIPPETL